MAEVATTRQFDRVLAGGGSKAERASQRYQAMRIASLNVENLFDRARALNQQTWARGKPMHGRINALLNKPLYSAADKQKIKDSLLEFGLEKRDDGGEWVNPYGPGPSVSRIAGLDSPDGSLSCL